MRRRDLVRRSSAAVAAVLGIGVLLTGAGAASQPVASAPLEVADATFAWSISDQTNARSHNPAAINFLSAGAADPGGGGRTLKQSQWAATVGSVTIQKVDAAGVWQPATWDGLGTDASGASIGVSGPYSGHRVLLSAGAGTLDADTDTAHLAWAGTFSVVYYGGNSVFTVTDPVLDLAGGTGAVTAVLGGWAADRDDPSIWTALAPQRVTIADVSGVDVTESGALATPAYRGVSVTGTSTQVRTGADWGSFPPSMVAYLTQMGIDAFWYSTGASNDPTKVAQAFTVGYSGVVPTPTAAPTTAATTSATAKPTNPIKTPPTTVTATVTATVTQAAAPVTVTGAAAPVVPPSAPPPVATAPAAADAGANAAPPAVEAVQVTAMSAASTPADGPTSAPWWIGGGLLVAAAVLLLLPVPRRRS